MTRREWPDGQHRWPIRWPHQQILALERADWNTARANTVRTSMCMGFLVLQTDTKAMRCTGLMPRAECTPWLELGLFALDERALRYGSAANATLAVCVTDCYPGTTGSTFATDLIGGVYLEKATKA